MAKLRGVWVRVALALSLLLPVWFLVGALGTKFGLLDWRVGFGLMTFVMGPLLMMGAAAFALIGLVLAILVPPRRGRRAALAALLIPLIGLGYGVSVQQRTKSIPPIHDVSTDLADPPAFSATAVAQRAAVQGGNALDLTTAVIPQSPRLGAWSGKSVVDAHRAAYGDLRPLTTDLSPADAYETALDAAEAQRGWTITTRDPAGGVIEAQVRSFWYGFTDDVAIRVRPLADGSGSVVDVRSVSRVGLSDLGANAARVRAYMATLNTKVGESATGG